MATATAIERNGFPIRVRYIVGAVILIPLLAHLVYGISTSPLTNYYMTVDELWARGAPGQQVRVGGPIVPGSIDWNNAARTLTFQLQGENRPLTVTYRGLAPDSFREGATVIVEGELGPGGTLAASNLLVKCPHQYIPAF